MPYADVDFFIALMKDADWLKENAEILLKENKDRIWTSIFTLVEILMVSEKYGLNPEIIVNAVEDISAIDGNTEKIKAAAHLMKEKNMTTFDALHAVSVGDDSIISSDSIYDKIGLKRIKLEK